MFFEIGFVFPNIMDNEYPHLRFSKKNQRTGNDLDQLNIFFVYVRRFFVLYEIGVYPILEITHAFA